MASAPAFKRVAKSDSAKEELVLGSPVGNPMRPATNRRESGYGTRLRHLQPFGP
jgi:hypothetical protein